MLKRSIKLLCACLMICTHTSFKLLFNMEYLEVYMHYSKTYINKSIQIRNIIQFFAKKQVMDFCQSHGAFFNNVELNTFFPLSCHKASHVNGPRL